MNTIRYTQGVSQYIPFFYVIWSDDLLSYSEISVIKSAIEGDETLTKEDQDTLLNWLDPKNPPLDEELKNWKKTISNSTVKLVESETYPLATFCQKLVCSYHEQCPFNDHLKDIEINLGIQPNHYKHLFACLLYTSPSPRD